MKKLSISFLLVVLLSLTASITIYAAEREILILGNDSKPPKYYLEENEPKGILVDIIRYTDTKIDHSFIVELIPWQRAYKEALSGKGGIIGLSKTKERLELFDYSDVMFMDTLILVVMRGKEFQYDTLHDLKGKTVGAQRGSSYGDDFEKAKTIFSIDLDDGADQRLLKLLHNRIDVALIGPGKAGLEAVIERNRQLKAHRDKFVILEKPFKVDPNYLGFSKNMKMKPFLKQFNKALKEGNQSGEIEKIIKEYSE